MGEATKVSKTAKIATMPAAGGCPPGQSHTVIAKAIQARAKIA